MRFSRIIFSVAYVLVTVNEVNAACRKSSSTAPASPPATTPSSILASPSPSTSIAGATTSSPSVGLSSDASSLSSTLFFKATFTLPSSAASPSPSTSIAGATTSSPSADASTEFSVSPTASPSSSPFLVTLDMMDKVNPNGKGDKCTDNADGPKECATNARAVIAINNAIKKHGYTSRGQIVGVVANMLYESGHWKYNIKHYNAKPGEGTRAMMSYENVELYAKFLYPSKVEELLANTNGKPDDKTKDAILALVANNDDDSFGSGFWFLKYSAKLFFAFGSPFENNKESMETYILKGIGAGTETVTDRINIWKTVNEAFKL